MFSTMAPHHKHQHGSHDDHHKHKHHGHHGHHGHHHGPHGHRGHHHGPHGPEGKHGRHGFCGESSGVLIHKFHKHGHHGRHQHEPEFLGGCGHRHIPHHKRHGHGHGHEHHFGPHGHYRRLCNPLVATTCGETSTQCNPHEAAPEVQVIPEMETLTIHGGSASPSPMHSAPAPNDTNEEN